MDGEAGQSFQGRLDRFRLGDEARTRTRSSRKRGREEVEEVKVEGQAEEDDAITGPTLSSPPTLPLLTDYLTTGLDLVFCGINPGLLSSATNCHFAHPVNHFWPCLHQAGFTARQEHPSYGPELLHATPFTIGMTNLVPRPTRNVDALGREECRAAVPGLLAKLDHFAPGLVCFVGKGIWQVIVKSSSAAVGAALEPLDLARLPVQPVVRFPPARDGFVMGLQPWRLARTMVWVVPSTSGRVTQFQRKDKILLFQDLFRFMHETRLARRENGHTVQDEVKMGLGEGEVGEVEEIKLELSM